MARLLAPHPNPFNPRTQLRYEIAAEGDVGVLIYDTRGRLVRRLFAGRLSAGPGFFTWDGRDDAGNSMPSGCYFARLTWEAKALDSKKLMLIR